MQNNHIHKTTTTYFRIVMATWHVSKVFLLEPSCTHSPWRSLSVLRSLGGGWGGLAGVASKIGASNKSESKQIMCNLIKSVVMCVESSCPYFIHRNEGGKAEEHTGWLFLSIRLSFTCSHLNHPPPLSLCLICPLLTHFCTYECSCDCVCVCCLCVHVRVCLAWPANSLCQKMSCGMNLELRKCPLLRWYVTRCQNGHAATFD